MFNGMSEEVEFNFCNDFGGIIEGEKVQDIGNSNIQVSLWKISTEYSISEKQ